MRAKLPCFALTVLALAVVTVAALGVVQWRRGADLPTRMGGERRLAAPDYGVVPDFTLTERSGRAFPSSELKGRVSVVDFIYTRCTDTCPLQSARMARLQEEFASAPDVRFLSISVDPEYDSPAVLSRYAARFGASPDRWLFLTGDKRTIYTLVQTGFHLAVEDSGLVTLPVGGPARPAIPPTAPQRTRLLGATPALAHTEAPHTTVMHSSWFVLVDRALRIHGYYPSEHPDGLRTLAQDVGSLVQTAR